MNEDHSSTIKYSGRSSVPSGMETNYSLKPSSFLNTLWNICHWKPSHLLQLQWVFLWFLLCYCWTYQRLKEVFTLLHEFLQIPSGKSEFRGIPWNFYGKQLAGASAILVSNSMEIPTFFQGIPMEMVGIPEPPGMIPMGIHGIPLEFHWNSARIPWESPLYI